MKWEDGVSTHKANDGKVSWRIRYRVPIAANSKLTKQVIETLPNCRNKDQAKTVLAIRRAAVFKGEWSPKTAKAPDTVRSFSATFLLAKRDLATVDCYRRQLELHLKPVFGDAPLDSITAGDCTDYRLARRDEGAAPATIRNEMRCLQSLMAEARRRGLCERNPVSAMRFDDIDNERGRLLSEKEMGRIIVAARSFENYMRPLFFVLYVTGARLGEAVELPWSAIDFDNGWIEMRNKGKSNRRKRAVMSALLRSELELWRDSGKQGQWIFPAQRDATKHRTVWTMRTDWAKLLARADVKDLRVHDLRHNLVTRLRTMGADDKLVMTQSGHSTLSMLNRYTHPEVEALRILLDRLPGRDLTLISDDDSPRTDAHVQTQINKPTRGR